VQGVHRGAGYQEKPNMFILPNEEPLLHEEKKTSARGGSSREKKGTADTVAQALPKETSK